LLDDYEDYLRVRNLPQWGNLHPRYEKMRQYAKSEQIKNNYAQVVQKMNDEEIANLSITLIHQAMYMLHKLLITMQERFVTEGGIKERMFQARVNYRNSQSHQSNQNNQSHQSNPNTLNVLNTPSSLNNQNPLNNNPQISQNNTNNRKGKV